MAVGDPPIYPYFYPYFYHPIVPSTQINGWVCPVCGKVNSPFIPSCDGPHPESPDPMAGDSNKP